VALVFHQNKICHQILSLGQVLVVRLIAIKIHKDLIELKISLMLVLL